MELDLRGETSSSVQGWIPKNSVSLACFEAQPQEHNFYPLRNLSSFLIIPRELTVSCT